MVNAHSAIIGKFYTDFKTNLSQSLWSLYSGSTLITDLTLEYAGSGSLSGSYSASRKYPYYQYGYLKFFIEI